MKYILILIFSSLLQITFAQSENSVVEIYNQLIASDNLDFISEIFIKKFPQGRFYLVGETHNYLANNDLMLALIKQLHPKGVYNVVNELPQATCFLFNEYLKTGNDSILSKIKPLATYNILRSIYEINKKQPNSNKIQFWGIDYLDRDDIVNYLFSLNIIRQRALNDTNIISNKISQFIDTISQIKKDTFSHEDVQIIVRFNKSLFDILTGDHATYYQEVFTDDYKDLVLMSSNHVGWKGRSDKTAFTGFQILSKYVLKEDTSTKFLSFYGAFHLEKLGYMLNTDNASIVKGKVVMIGLQYYNCKGNFPWLPQTVSTNGISFLYKKNKFNLLSGIMQTNATIHSALFLNPDEYLGLKSNKMKISALFIFNQYGDRRMHSWKFD